jgi:hypothetical protein
MIICYIQCTQVCEEIDQFMSYLALELKLKLILKSKLKLKPSQYLRKKPVTAKTLTLTRERREKQGK